MKLSKRGLNSDMDGTHPNCMVDTLPSAPSCRSQPLKEIELGENWGGQYVTTVMFPLFPDVFDFTLEAKA